MLVGVGHLGSALLAYKEFEREDFEIVAGFDDGTERHRRKRVVQPIYRLDNLEKYVRQHGIKIGIITVPPAVAQDVANRLIAAGVNAILNFAPVVLRVPSNVNFGIELENLSYFRSLAEG